MPTLTLRQCEVGCSFGIPSSELFYRPQTLWRWNNSQISQVKNVECFRHFFLIPLSFNLCFVMMWVLSSGWVNFKSAWLPKTGSSKPCSGQVVVLCFLVLGPKALWTGVLSANLRTFHDWQEKQELGDTALNSILYALSMIYPLEYKGKVRKPQELLLLLHDFLHIHIHLLKVN